MQGKRPGHVHHEENPTDTFKMYAKSWYLSDWENTTVSNRIQVSREVQSWTIDLLHLIFSWCYTLHDWAPFCVTTIGFTQFIRPIGQISKWYNAIECWLWGDTFTNSRLSIHSVQNGRVLCELKIYAKMASNHIECVRQHLAISLCWYAVWNYVFLYKADRKPKERPLVRCNAMVRRVCLTWEHSRA